MYSFMCCSSKVESHTHKPKEPKHRPKNADTHKHTHTNQEHARGKIQYILCQDVWRIEKPNTYQGGLVSAWNAFLLNVFTSMRIMKWWNKLFNAKEPEKEKLVLKISVLVLGKSRLFPWTWRRSERNMRSFRYCGALPWTTFCITTHLLSNCCLQGVVWEHSTFDCSPY